MNGPGFRGRRPFEARSLRSLAPQGDGDSWFVLIQRLGVALLGLIALTAAAIAQPSLQCSGAQKPWTVAELLFGRGNVSDFELESLSSTRRSRRAFPMGSRSMTRAASGGIRRASKISRERSKVVMIAMPPDAGNEAKLQEIIEAYKTRFKQQSVGLILRAVLRVFLGLKDRLGAFLPSRHQCQKIEGRDHGPPEACRA